MKKVVIVIAIVLIVIGIKYFTVLIKQEAFAPTPVQATLPPQVGLPASVEATRQKIYTAAKNNNYEALVALTDGSFRYSFGGDYEGGFAAYLKHRNKEGDHVFTIMQTLLALPYVKKDEYYIWPSYFGKTTTQWTNADIEAMKTYMSSEAIEGNRQFGGYIGYRLGISEDGTWVYFLAGD